MDLKIGPSTLCFSVRETNAGSKEMQEEIVPKYQLEAWKMKEVFEEH